MVRIGELCQFSGLSKDGIRYYEELGLIHSSEKPAGSRTYRDYHPDSLKRLELIQCGKEAGFSLKEIQPLLDPFIKGSLSDREWQQLLEQKLAELDQRESAIRKMKLLITTRI